MSHVHHAFPRACARGCDGRLRGGMLGQRDTVPDGGARRLRHRRQRRTQRRRRPSPRRRARSGAAASPSPSPAGLVPPDRIKTAGKLVFCIGHQLSPRRSSTPPTAPPRRAPTSTSRTEIAKRSGVTAEIDNTGFDSIIPALTAKKCDLIISGMNDTADRAKQVDFVDYLKVGQGLLVPTGNPKGIQTLDGPVRQDRRRPAGDDQPRRAQRRERHAQGGRQAADRHPRLPGGHRRLPASSRLGRVDAYSTDSPVVAYYNSLPGNAGKYEVGGTPIDPAPIGIAMRKDDTGMKAAVQAADRRDVRRRRA